MSALGLLLRAVGYIALAIFVLGTLFGVVVCLALPWIGPYLRRVEAAHEAARKAAQTKAAPSPFERLEEATRAAALVPEELRRELLRREAIAWDLHLVEVVGCVDAHETRH